MSQDERRRPGWLRQAALLAVILLLLLPLMVACDAGATMQEVAGQVGAAIEAASTLEAQAHVTPTRTPRPRASRTPTPTTVRTRRATPAATMSPTRRATRTATPTARPSSSGVSGLPTIRFQDLPKQARETIALIEQGGPFPFERDGIPFQNREQLLPRKRSGYYREYTVITPGSRDRGARRIVAGAEGELYYTDDHYESFREVIR
jgi:ribonuclease T1